MHEKGVLEKFWILNFFIWDQSWATWANVKIYTVIKFPYWIAWKWLSQSAQKVTLTVKYKCRFSSRHGDTSDPVLLTIFLHIFTTFYILICTFLVLTILSDNKIFVSHMGYTPATVSLKT